MGLRNLPGKISRLARSLSAAQASPDDDWAARFLQDGELPTFLAMDPRDREHAVRVARAVLREAPDASAELVAAALLHDCGKSLRTYRVWERVLTGLMPQRWGGRFAWGPLHVRARHPDLGAAMLRAAGARERVAQLVERHHAPAHDPEARLLHRYDDLE